MASTAAWRGTRRRPDGHDRARHAETETALAVAALALVSLRRGGAAAAVNTAEAQQRQAQQACQRGGGKQVSATRMWQMRRLVVDARLLVVVWLIAAVRLLA